MIREVCDRILSEDKVSVADLRKRAVAMGILGECFEAVKKDADAAESILPPPKPTAQPQKPPKPYAKAK